MEDLDYNYQNQPNFTLGVADRTVAQLTDADFLFSTACKMAAAISQDMFVDVRPREDDFVSESGIIVGSKEIEELIEGEISRFGASRRRIDAKLICQ